MNGAQVAVLLGVCCGGIVPTTAIVGLVLFSRLFPETWNQLLDRIFPGGNRPELK